MNELSATVATETKDFYFTFGFNHAHPNSYVVIHGTINSSRDEMFRRYGNKWAFQYDSREKAQVDKWKMEEVK